LNNLLIHHPEQLLPALYSVNLPRKDATRNCHSR